MAFAIKFFFCLVSGLIIVLTPQYTNLQTQQQDSFIVDAHLRQYIYDYFLEKPPADVTPTDLEKITHLYIGYSKNKIKSLKGIEYCNNLTRLSITDHDGIKDLSPISALKNLRVLNLRNINITDLKPLSDLLNLDTLRISQSKLSDITPLNKLTKLKVLDLSNNTIQDISTLKNFPNLIQLHLTGNKIKDISSLRELRKIRVLALGQNQITDISAVKNLVRLHHLHLEQNQIKDISPLQDLIELNGLSLRHNQITTIAPLKKISGLNRLYLNHNSISDISPLAKLTKLIHLYLHHNKISDISPLGLNLKNGGFKQGLSWQAAIKISSDFNLTTIDITGNNMDLSKATPNKNVIESFLKFDYGSHQKSPAYSNQKPYIRFYWKNGNRVKSHAPKKQDKILLIPFQK